MQELDERNEPPSKTFEYINRFARFVAEHNGAAYECRVTHVPLTEQVRAVVLEPPFGSNITVLEDVKPRALLVITAASGAVRATPCGSCGRFFLILTSGSAKCC